MTSRFQGVANNVLILPMGGRAKHLSPTVDSLLQKRFLLERYGWQLTDNEDGLSDTETDTAQLLRSGVINC